MPETLPHENTSYWTTPLGDSTHTLARRVAEGTLVGRGHISYWREDGKREGDEEERGAALRDVYTTPTSPRAYNTGKRVECNCSHTFPIPPHHQDSDFLRRPEHYMQDNAFVTLDVPRLGT
jgi:hypothetical protein